MQKIATGTSLLTVHSNQEVVINPSPGDLYLGRRICVRQAFDKDDATFDAWARDPLFAYYQPLCWHTADYKSLWRSRRKLLQTMNPQVEVETIIEDSERREPIGAALLTGFDSLNRKAEFSLYFAKRRKGRCVIEALHALLYSAFERLDLRKLTCYVAPENSNAQSIVSSLGFSVEGLFKAELLDDRARPRDFLRLVLFSDDWFAQDSLRTRLAAIAPLAENGFIG